MDAAATGTTTTSTLCVPKSSSQNPLYNNVSEDIHHSGSKLPYGHCSVINVAPFHERNITAVPNHVPYLTNGQSIIIVIVDVIITPPHPSSSSSSSLHSWRPGVSSPSLWYIFHETISQSTTTTARGIIRIIVDFRIHRHHRDNGTHHHTNTTTNRIIPPSQRHDHDYRRGKCPRI